MRIKRKYLTFETVGIDISSTSGPESQFSPSSFGEGLAAALRCFGNILRVRATRKPRMNMH